MLGDASDTWVKTLFCVENTTSGERRLEIRTHPLSLGDAVGAMREELKKKDEEAHVSLVDSVEQLSQLNAAAGRAVETRKLRLSRTTAVLLMFADKAPAVLVGVIFSLL